MIYQLDIFLNITINISSGMYNGQKPDMDVVGVWLFYYIEDQPNSINNTVEISHNVVVYMMTNDYSCSGGCTSCYDTYQVNTTTTKCQKVVITATNTNTNTNTTNTNNTITNTSTNNNTNNSSSNMTYNNTLPASNS